MGPRAGPPASRSRDRIVLVAVVLVAGLVLGLAQARMDPRLLTWEAVDVWFEADAPRAYDNLVERWSNFRRTTTHPLFPTLAHTPVAILTDVLGMDDGPAVFLYTAVLAAVWAGAFFLFLRLAGCVLGDALLFTALGVASASALSFLTIPETFGWGSLSIVAALCLAAKANRAPVHWAWAFLACVFTWGTTLTNVMVAGLASMIRRGLARATAIALSALALVLGWWLLQRLVFPSSGVPFGQVTQKGPLLTPESGGAWTVLRSFFFHTLVMPAAWAVDRPGAGKWPILLAQSTKIGAAGAVALTASAVWIALLASGLWAAAKRTADRPLCGVLVVSLVGQAAVAVVYGKETFLYSLHFLPILLGIAALGTGTKLRGPVRALAGALLVLLLWNNVPLFLRTTRFLDEHPELHHDVKGAREARSQDPWPRREGAVKLAWPDSRGFFLGWHALGGSFSPGFDTFTISIWVLGADGELVTTGDDLPSEQIREEQDVPDPDQPATSIRTETPYYVARWTVRDLRRFRLELEPKPGEHRLALAVRGVGAQPGPLRRLERTPEGVLANGRFALEVEPRARVHLGIEGPPGWLRERSDAASVESLPGWCWALFEPPPGTIALEVRDRVETGYVDTYLFQIGAAE